VILYENGKNKESGRNKIFSNRIWLKEFGNPNKAFDVTKTENGAKTSKAKYANSSLATLGDAVIKLYHTNTLFNCGNLNSHDITGIRAKCENNKHLSDVCNMLRYPNLIYADKNQSSDNLVDDPATLLEAIIAAIFLEKGFEETSAIIDEKIPYLVFYHK